MVTFASAGSTAQSRANQVCREMGLQGRVMWFDAEANLWTLSTRKGVAEQVRRCKEANINTIVVDVKPLSGLVLYRSRIAPRLNSFRGKPYPANYDLLGTMVEECRKAGIAVHAAVNVFSEGSHIEGGGPAHKHRDWQCVTYGLVRSVWADDDPQNKLSCADCRLDQGDIALFPPGAKNIGRLPAATFFARIAADGRPIGWGEASGYARLSAPEDGYLLIATGKSRDWLRSAVERRAAFRIDAKLSLGKVGDGYTTHNAIFVNPLHPGARAHALSVIREICGNYAIDGIVLDRMRYPGIYTDFSDLTRQAFEEYIGVKVANWPEDIFVLNPIPGGEITRGMLFKSWLKFRAKVMRDFLAEAREIAKSRRPSTKLGIYVGSWYPLYYDVGVNWGSRSHSADFEWWPDGYEETGYADLVDYMCTGCYYAHPTRLDAAANGDEDWKSVEAAAEESINAVKDDTFVYGSLYVLQYSGRPKKFAEAIEQCLKLTQGCMLFDLVYVRNYNWWDVVKASFPGPAKAPHDVAGLLRRVRDGARRATIDR